jgi:putative membrane protein
VLGIPVRQFVQGILVPAILGASAGPGVRFAVVVVAVLLTVTFVVRTLAWRRFRFSFDGEVLRVDEGVVSRNHRALDVARIQQVEVERSLLQRVFGLATLRVETAGAGNEAEVELRVLPQEDADTLRAAVRASKAALGGGGTRTSATTVAASDAGDEEGAGSAGEDGEAGRTVLHVRLGRIVLAAVTGSRLLVLPAVLGAATQFIGEGEGGTLDPETVLRGLLELGLVVVVLLLIPASVAAAVVVGVVRDFDWTLRRVGDDLHVTRGLTSTRSSVLPLHRVQLVEIQRNWLRRVLGYATVRIHSAGSGGGGDRRVTVPLLRERDVDGLLPELLPGVEGVPRLEPHPRGALRRSVFRWARSALWIVVPLTALSFVPEQVLPLPALAAPLPWVAAGVFVVSLGFGVIEYRQLAHGRTERVIASRHGALSVRTVLAPLPKVQAVSLRTSWFQRRLGVTTVTAHVAGPGGDLTVLDTGTEVGHRLQRDLVVAAADPIVPQEVASADTGVAVAPDPS